MLLLRPPRPTLFPYTTLFRSQRVQNADLGPTGAQRIHGDTALGHGNGEVSDEGLQSRLGRTHADPRLQPARAAALGVGDREDSTAVTHEGKRFSDPDEKGLGL